ncbi:MAG TPA: hypothetical protein VNF50_13400 [Acidimicrobiales bacterium]|nr:hypothetical protein [Acidimicrobiales bacterium]
MALIRLGANHAPGRPGWVALSGLAVRAFADQPQSKMQWPVARPFCLRALVLLSILTSDVRVHPDGQAFCLLARPSVRRDVLAVSLMAAAVAALAGMVVAAPILFWVVVVAILVLILPSLRLSLLAHRAHKVLARSSPTRPYVGVHTVTSTCPGHGRQLMADLGREADSKGWTLVLDAANEALAGYYSDLGYMSLSRPVLMPWGERAVRMSRTPTIEQGVG